ncbi:MAG: hypothetical protein ACI9R3_004286 [Verrucomicrobiales bacterium]
MPSLVPIVQSAVNATLDWGSSRSERKGLPNIRMHWIAGVLFLGCFMAGWAIRPYQERTPIQRIAKPPTDAELGRQLESQIQSAHQTIRAFLGSSTITGKRHFIRNADEVLPLMINWYSKHPHVALEVTKFEMMASTTLNQRPFWVAMVFVKDAPPQTLMLEDTLDGFQIDWEAFAGFNATPVKQLIEQRPLQPRSLRVYATPVSYYPEGFDETEFLSLKLECRNQSEFLYGYLERDNTFAETIEFVTRGKVRIPLQFELQFRQNASDATIPNSIEIRSLISPNWLGLR